MWSIAVCDGSIRVGYALEEMLEDYCGENGIAAEVELFQNGFSLYESMRKGNRYDLIFLEILMLGPGGGEMGRVIRNRLDNQEVHLIYMSDMAGHANLLMNNRPTGFLEKPLRRKRVFQLAEHSRKLAVRLRQQFVFQKKKIIYQVPYQEIIYFQSMGRMIRVHTASEILEFYGKLPEIIERGLPGQFIQVHQSYVINTDYLICLSRERVYLKGQNGSFSVSQPYRQNIMDHFADILTGDEGNSGCG